MILPKFLITMLNQRNTRTYLHPLYHNHRHNSFHHCHHLYHYVFHLKKCRWHVYLRVVLFLRQLVFRFHLQKHFISMIVKFVFTMNFEKNKKSSQVLKRLTFDFNVDILDIIKWSSKNRKNVHDENGRQNECQVW